MISIQNFPNYELNIIFTMTISFIMTFIFSFFYIFILKTSSGFDTFGYKITIKKIFLAIIIYFFIISILILITRPNSINEFADYLISYTLGIVSGIISGTISGVVAVIICKNLRLI